MEVSFYGVEIPTYRIPCFMPMRIFALEFIIQTMHMDQIHFIPARKGLLFKLPRTIGPFVVYDRQETKEA